MTGLARTVLGDIQPAQLGFCDCHSHPMLISDFMTAKLDEFDTADYQKSRLEVADFVRAGGHTLVDCQPVGTGRATQFLAPLSMDTGAAIIACTGFHVEFFYPDDHWGLSASEDGLTRLFIDEIESGMYYDDLYRFPSRRCSSKAGLIKCGTESPKLSGRYERRLNAAINACLQTGAPMLCHTDNGSGLAHCEYLLRRGVPPDRIIMAHLDRAPLPLEDYIYPIARLGVFLEFDALGAPGLKDEALEVADILRLFGDGLADNLVLGLDPTRPKMVRYGGAYGFTYIPDAFSKALLGAGLSERDLRRLTVDTPARALAFK